MTKAMPGNFLPGKCAKRLIQIEIKKIITVKAETAIKLSPISHSREGGNPSSSRHGA